MITWQAKLVLLMLWLVVLIVRQICDLFLDHIIFWLVATSRTLSDEAPLNGQGLQELGHVLPGFPG